MVVSRCQWVRVKIGPTVVGWSMLQPLVRSETKTWNMKHAFSVCHIFHTKFFKYKEYKGITCSNKPTNFSDRPGDMLLKWVGLN